MTVHLMSSALRTGKTSQRLHGPPIPRSDMEPPTGCLSEDTAGRRPRTPPPSWKRPSPCSANPQTPPAPTRWPFPRLAPSAQPRLPIARLSPASPPPCGVLPSAALARFSRTSETVDLRPGGRCRSASGSRLLVRLHLPHVTPAAASPLTFRRGRCSTKPTDVSTAELSAEPSVTTLCLKHMAFVI